MVNTVPNQQYLQGMGQPQNTLFAGYGNEQNAMAQNAAYQQAGSVESKYGIPGYQFIPPTVQAGSNISPEQLSSQLSGWINQNRPAGVFTDPQWQSLSQQYLNNMMTGTWKTPYVSGLPADPYAAKAASSGTTAATGGTGGTSTTTGSNYIFNPYTGGQNYGAGQVGGYGSNAYQQLLDYLQMQQGGSQGNQQNTGDWWNTAFANP